MKVLIIEDAEEVVESIKICVSIRWPECTALATPHGKTGLRMVETESPDLVILDLATWSATRARSSPPGRSPRTCGD